jgi:Uma2 family endonuclease
MRLSTIARRREPDDEVLYPSSDGKPMGETDAHVNLISETIGKLRRYFKRRKEVAYVAGNNFLYYEEGVPRSCVSPDTYVVFGVKQRNRRSYKTWEEGSNTPDVVFEFTSKKTRNEDMETKLAIYERTLEVDEYFLFDPTGDYLQPQLRGYRLNDGRYAPIEFDGGRLLSKRLGLHLEIDGDCLNLYDAFTGEKLLSGDEQEAWAEEERLRRLAEQSRADEQQARANEERKHRIAEQARADQQQTRADEERQMRLAEKARADEQQARANALATEVEELRSRLAG